MTPDDASDVDYEPLIAELAAEARTLVASADPRCPVCGEVCTVESLALPNLSIRVMTTCPAHGAQTMIDPFDGTAPPR